MSASGVKLNGKILSNVAKKEGGEISLFLGVVLASDVMDFSKNLLQLCVIRLKIDMGP